MKQKHIFILLLLLITIILIACLTQKETAIQQTKVTTTELPTSISGIEIPLEKSDLQIVEHPGFTLAYCEKHEQAAWVAYELTADEIAGSVSRTDRFLEDPAITTGSATDSDYKGSGYDRGHLAPAADMKWSEEAMNASFYFSNMSPQVPAFNRGIWKRAEEQVRDWATQYGGVYIATGPVLNDILTKTGRNQVSVPAFYYKTVMDKKMTKIITLLIPNKGSKADLQTFCISTDSLEKITGIDFFPKLTDSTENRLESENIPERWSWSN